MGGSPWSPLGVWVQEVQVLEGTRVFLWPAASGYHIRYTLSLNPQHPHHQTLVYLTLRCAETVTCCSVLRSFVTGALDWSLDELLGDPWLAGLQLAEPQVRASGGGWDVGLRLQSPIAQLDGALRVPPFAPFTLYSSCAHPSR